MNLSSNDDVRRLYEDSADWYDTMMEQEIQLPMYQEVLDDLSAKLDGVIGSIVDSSCGTGHMLERIGSEFDSAGRKLIGIDLSTRMVELSRKRLGDSATILEGDMGEMVQLADASSACVISFFAIHHVDLDGFQRCLAEWNRVLVCGGHLVLAAWEGTASVTMMFKLAQSAEKKWRKLRGHQHIPDLIQGVKFINGVNENQVTTDELKASETRAIQTEIVA